MTITMQSCILLPFCDIYYVSQLIFFFFELMFFYLSEAVALAHVQYSWKQQCIAKTRIYRIIIVST